MFFALMATVWFGENNQLQTGVTFTTYRKKRPVIVYFDHWLEKYPAEKHLTLSWQKIKPG